MIKILIADDHAILRRGLKEFLVRELKEVECGEAGNAPQVLDLVREQEWDLLILDVTLPGRSGLDILADLKKVNPELPVLVLSMHPEKHLGKRALKAGASGYMNKEAAPEELIRAIRKLLAGDLYVSPVLAERLAWDLREHTGASLHEALSDREFEVLRALALGKTVTQIAEELHLSTATVSTHRAHILEKMGMTTTADLIRYAVRHHLVE
jgi:DNA-binding NarL/FixJ family response regulator